MTLSAFDILTSVQSAADIALGYIPNIVGFLLILIIGYIVIRIIRGIVTKALQKLGLDKALHGSDAGTYVEKVSPGSSPSKLIGAVVFYALFVFVLSAAIGALKIPAVTVFMQSVFDYLPNVIAAVLIFVVAAAIAGGVAAAVHKAMGDTPTGKVVRGAVPGLVMAIAVFMILTQLKIAPNIVLITYAGLIFALSLGSALAFGLGGRELARDALSKAADAGAQQKEQVKGDLQTGRSRAEDQATEARRPS